MSVVRRGTFLTTLNPKNIATYTITIPDDSDAKFRAIFPEGEALFQRVVADAVLDYDRKTAEASIPPVVRIEEQTVEVSVDKTVESAPMPEPEAPVPVDVSIPV